MADDVVDTIAQYDLDDDFPDYANEQNKELNQIVRFKPAPPELEDFPGTTINLLAVKFMAKLILVSVFKLYL